jgi:hypothetical protein
MRKAQAIRAGRLPDDIKLAALSSYTKALIERRGHVSDSELQNFKAAGYTPAQAFEVIAGLAVSTMANYAGNIANPPLEALCAARVKRIGGPGSLPGRATRGRGKRAQPSGSGICAQTDRLL